MKHIIVNEHNLTDNDISRKVVRVKALIFNSKGKVLIAHNNNTFQFPGGHLEDNEDINNCLIREIKEEVGIDIDEVSEEPFLCISTYDNDYFGTSEKVLSVIYYFRVFSDKKPNFDETHYDALELQSEFNLYYVLFADLDIFLKNSTLSLGNPFILNSPFLT